MIDPAPEPTTEPTGEPTGEPTEPHTEAHRPHVSSPKRLIPLGVLVLCVAAASVVGLVNGGPVSPTAPAAALPASPAAPKDARKVCTPPYDAGHRTEPWRGRLRSASGKTFKQRMARENAAYVRGQKGWVFWSDYQADNFSQALGRITQSRKKLNKWAAYFKKAEAATRAAGGEFHVVVSPANWNAYRQRLPKWALPLRGSTSLERLMAAHPELPWIDTRKALRDESADHATYEPKDSHWTPYGGWVAWQAITRCLRADRALKSVREPEITGVGTVANSNEFAQFGVKPGKPARTVPLFAHPHPATTYVHVPDDAPVQPYPDGAIDATLLPVKTTTSGALSDKTLVAFRDSTGNALSPLWDQTFATTITYPHGVGMAAPPPDISAIVNTYHPDVVLYVITERFLTYNPPK